jgi:hypothetical protein
MFCVSHDRHEHICLENFGGLIAIQSPPSQNFVQRVAVSQHDSESQVILWHGHSPRYSHYHMLDSIHIIHHVSYAL